MKKKKVKAAELQGVFNEKDIELIANTSHKYFSERPVLLKKAR